MSSDQKAPEGTNLDYALLLPGGGLILGSGIMMLWYSVGYQVDGVQLSMGDHLSSIGASGINDLSLLDAADYSIGMVVLGALLMIFLNAGAWKRTGGY